MSEEYPPPAATGSDSDDLAPLEESLRVDEKQRQAAAWRLAGVPLALIAERLGYARESSAHSAVEAGLRVEFTEPDSATRKLELSRLDSLLVGLWPKAKAGDVRAIDRVLRLMERRAKYLGLDYSGTEAPAQGESELDRQRRARDTRRRSTG